MKKLIILFALLMPFFSFAQTEQVNVEDAQDLLANGAILVDVRENDEVSELAYQSEGMLHIPLSELASRSSELPKDKTLIMACSSGFKSQNAITELSKLGFTKTVNLEGGIEAWQEKGYPVITKGITPVEKACCSKGAGKGKSTCSGKSANKECTPKEGKSCCKKTKS